MKLQNKARGDIIVVAALLIIAAAAAFFSGNTSGSTVVITVDGKVYGEYPLNKNAVVEINEHNTVTINDGEAYMSFSDCRNHECEKSGGISAKGEVIVCLPNKVLISVKGSAGFDAVTS